MSWVGKAEEECKQEGIPYKAGTFPFAANGRALAAGEGSGMAKVIAHAEADRVLGVHIVGPNWVTWWLKP